MDAGFTIEARRHREFLILETGFWIFDALWTRVISCGREVREARTLLLVSGKKQVVGRRDFSPAAFRAEFLCCWGTQGLRPWAGSAGLSGRGGGIRDWDEGGMDGRLWRWGAGSGEERGVNRQAGREARHLLYTGGGLGLLGRCGFVGFGRSSLCRGLFGGFGGGTGLGNESTLATPAAAGLAVLEGSGGAVPLLLILHG